jgi:predicted RNase H-like HicB family nuclease
MAREARVETPVTEQVEVEGKLYTFRIEKDGKWFVGVCDEIPGWCASQGRTLDELRLMVADAIRECLLSLEQHQDAAETPS